MAKSQTVLSANFNFIQTVVAMSWKYSVLFFSINSLNIGNVMSQNVHNALREGDIWFHVKSSNASLFLFLFKQNSSVSKQLSFSLSIGYALVIEVKEITSNANKHNKKLIPKLHHGILQIKKKVLFWECIRFNSAIMRHINSQFNIDLYILGFFF